MADIRACEQCGTEFTPRREHARFCSAGCRMAWNRGDARQATVSLAALDWSVNAMTEVIARLTELSRRADATERPKAGSSGVIAVSDATWWVTLVDATLVRYHPGGYDAALASLAPAEREEVEQILAGLRYVRNQMGVHLDPAEFIHAGTWSSLPEPETGELTPRGREWERSRYQAYQEWLAGRPVAKTFELAARFLRLTAASSQQGDYPPPGDLPGLSRQARAQQAGPSAPESSLSA